MNERIDKHEFYRLYNSNTDAFYPLLIENYTSLPFYIVSMGKTNKNTKMQRPGYTYSGNNRQMVCPNGYLHYMFLYSVKGSGKVVFGHTETPVPSGSLIFYSPGVPYNYEPIEEPWETRWIVFNGYAVKKLLPFKSGIFTLSNTNKDEIIFNQLFNCFKSLDWENTSSYLLYKLLLHSISDFFSNNQVVSSKQKLESVIEYLNNSYYKDISLDDISKIANVSQTHLCRLFKESYNLRPFEYLTQLRIAKAKEMMQLYPDMLTSEISNYVGFKSHSYFTSLFKKSENITPSEFRNIL